MDEFIETAATEEYRYLRWVIQVSFRQAPIHADINEFQSFLLKLKNQKPGENLRGFFPFTFCFWDISF